MADLPKPMGLAICFIGRSVRRPGTTLALPVDFRSLVPAIVAGAMNIVKATRQFEEWLGHRTDLVKKDLRLKHANMKAAVFPFLRATYYRWAQVWPQVCPDLAKAPHVLAVGDLHVENFGTWRDVEGRLIWGVNDFDEAHPMAYANDLVRLAVSAHLASEAGHLPLKHKDICDSDSRGLSRRFARAGGLPFVLGEKNEWLRQIAESELRDPVHFWAKMDALPTMKSDVPISAIDAIEHLMPARDLDLPPRASRGRAGKPGPRPLCRHRRLARRQNRPRSQSPGLLRLLLG